MLTFAERSVIIDDIATCKGTYKFEKNDINILNFGQETRVE